MTKKPLYNTLKLLSIALIILSVIACNLISLTPALASTSNGIVENNIYEYTEITGEYTGRNYVAYDNNNQYVNIQSLGSNISINNKTITTNGNTTVLNQYLDLEAGTYTIAYYISSINNNAKIDANIQSPFTTIQAINFNTTGLKTLTFTAANSVRYQIRLVMYGGNYTIDYMKLEKGSEFTGYVKKEYQNYGYDQGVNYGLTQQMDFNSNNVITDTLKPTVYNAYWQSMTTQYIEGTDDYILGDYAINKVTDTSRNSPIYQIDLGQTYVAGQYIYVNICPKGTYYSLNNGTYTQREFTSFGITTQDIQQTIDNYTELNDKYANLPKVINESWQTPYAYENNTYIYQYPDPQQFLLRSDYNFHIKLYLTNETRYITLSFYYDNEDSTKIVGGNSSYPKTWNIEVKRNNKNYTNEYAYNFLFYITQAHSNTEYIYKQGYKEGNKDKEKYGLEQYNLGLETAQNGSFWQLMYSVVNAPVRTIIGNGTTDDTGLLNFEFLGVNMSSFVMSILSLMLIIGILKLVIR